MELQSKILGLCDDSATANLRQTCRSLEAHAWLMARRRPCIEDHKTYALPYLSHLVKVCCPLDRRARARSCFVAKVLDEQPAAWPRLTALALAYGSTSAAALRGNLHLATNLTQLRVDARPGRRARKRDATLGTPAVADAVLATGVRTGI
jgi:hypothetical protein